MWFKRCQLFRFSNRFQMTADALAESLQEKAFQPCGPQDSERMGWAPPLGRYGSDLVHTGNGFMMLCARRQAKLLPAAVVNELLEERLSAVEDGERPLVSRKRRKEMKEALVFELLPKAFTRSSLIYAYLAPAENLLVINNSSSSRAEELLGLLRDSLGALSLVPVACQAPVVERMTHWVKGDIPLPAGWELGEACELRDKADEKSIVRCKNRNLTAAEIEGHINAGMQVSKLALNWHDKIGFMLDEKLVLRQIQYGELIEEQIEGAADPAEQFDQDFSLMTLELEQMIQSLLQALGGYAEK